MAARAAGVTKGPSRISAYPPGMDRSARKTSTETPSIVISATISLGTRYATRRIWGRTVCVKRKTTGRGAKTATWRHAFVTQLCGLNSEMYSNVLEEPEYLGTITDTLSDRKAM